MSTIIDMAAGIVQGATGLLKPPKTPGVVTVKPPEKTADKEEEKRKLKVTSTTVLTTPLGLTGEAPIRKPTLLGG